MVQEIDASCQAVTTSSVMTYVPAGSCVNCRVRLALPSSVRLNDVTPRLAVLVNENAWEPTGVADLTMVNVALGQVTVTAAAAEVTELPFAAPAVAELVIAAHDAVVVGDWT